MKFDGPWGRGWVMDREEGCQDLFVRFRVRASDPRWWFVGLSTGEVGKTGSYDALRLPVVPGRWTNVEVWEIAGTYHAALDGGEPFAVRPETVGSAGPGDYFGFEADVKGFVEVQDVVAKVLRRR
jgi:hypothetical protein